LIGSGTVNSKSVPGMVYGPSPEDNKVVGLGLSQIHCLKKTLEIKNVTCKVIKVI
jgi:hypothetical protein